MPRNLADAQPQLSQDLTVVNFRFQDTGQEIAELFLSGLNGVNYESSCSGFQVVLYQQLKANSK